MVFAVTLSMLRPMDPFASLQLRGQAVYRAVSNSGRYTEAARSENLTRLRNICGLFLIERVQWKDIQMPVTYWRGKSKPRVHLIWGVLKGHCHLSELLRFLTILFRNSSWKYEWNSLILPPSFMHRICISNSQNYRKICEVQGKFSIWSYTHRIYHFHI